MTPSLLRTLASVRIDFGCSEGMMRMPSLRIALVSQSRISVSRKRSSLSRRSMIVTLEPSRAKIVAYSHPITPLPRMARLRGMTSRSAAGRNDDVIRFDDLFALSARDADAGGGDEGGAA